MQKNKHFLIKITFCSRITGVNHPFFTKSNVGKLFDKHGYFLSSFLKKKMENKNILMAMKYGNLILY